MVLDFTQPPEYSRSPFTGYRITFCGKFGRCQSLNDFFTISITALVIQACNDVICWCQYLSRVADGRVQSATQLLNCRYRFMSLRNLCLVLLDRPPDVLHRKKYKDYMPQESGLMHRARLKTYIRFH